MVSTNAAPMAGAGPVLIQDRTTSAPVSHVTLSPHMNLLALVLDRTSVAIFRLSWHRLATIPLSTAEDEHIVSIVWSPDGANLLVATSAANLTILSVDRSAFASSSARAKRVARDTGAILATITLPVPPTALAWVPEPSNLSYAGEGPVYEDRGGLLAPTAREGGLHAQGLIFCGDQQGFLTVLSHNLLFLIARLPVLPEEYGVAGLHVNPVMSHCFVYGQKMRAGDGLRTRGRSRDAECVMRAICLDNVLDYWPEIQRIGVEVVAVKQFVEMVKAATEKVEACWLQGAAEVTKGTIFEPMQKLLADFAEIRSQNPWEMLHYVFCGGNVDGAVLQFLAAEMSENGAKEALRAFRGHVDDLSDVLHEIVPIAESSVVRACEYQGLSKLRSRFSSVGLKEDEASRLFELTESLYWALGDITWELESIATETEAFLAWLVIAAARAGGNTNRGRTAVETANLTGEDGRLVSKFFQRMTAKSELHETMTPLDPVTEMFKTCVIPAVDNHRSFCDAMLSRPVLASYSPQPADEGMFFSVSDQSDIVRPKFRNVRSGDKQNSYEGTEIHLVTEDGSLISAIFRIRKEEWSLAHTGFLDEKFFIYDCSSLTSACVAYVVSKMSTYAACKDSDEELQFELLIHDEAQFAHSKYQRISLDKNSKDRKVLVPNVSQMHGAQVERLEAGEVEGTVNPSLSIDGSHRHASMTHPPNRVLLFRLGES